MTPVAWVLLLGSITALATGLGALPFLFVQGLAGRTIARANALASGLMLGASFGLLIEGSQEGMAQTVVGSGLGVLFIMIGARLLADKQVSFGEIRGVDARRILLIVAVMTIHSFSEGVAIGVAYGGGEKLATLITVAISVHNVPEGLAISAVMRPRGATVMACAGWSIFSSIPQPLMALPAYLFVEAFRGVLPYGLGFAAGAMVFMVFQELLPQAYEGLSRAQVGLLVSLTMAMMVLFQALL